MLESIADAIRAGCEDPVIQFFNLGERESLEVAAEIIGQELRAQPAGELEGGHRADAVRSLNCAMSRSDATQWLSVRPAFKVVADYLNKPQDTEALIRCIVYDSLREAGSGRSSSKMGRHACQKIEMATHSRTAAPTWAIQDSHSRAKPIPAASMRPTSNPIAHGLGQ